VSDVPHAISRNRARRRPTGVSASKPTGLPPFERLIEAHGPALLRFCAAQVGSDRAEDVFQETMVAALRAYDRLRDATSLRAWLFQIAARKAIDAHRARARAPQPVPDPEASASAVVDRPLVDQTVWEPVRALPEKQRNAVTLRFLGDLSHREIAEVMQTSEDAARRNVFEALRRLRSQLEPTPTAGGSPR
jgi:RNA polymerase sigma factor (sigma-70 family)